MHWIIQFGRVLQIRRWSQFAIEPTKPLSRSTWVLVLWVCWTNPSDQVNYESITYIMSQVKAWSRATVCSMEMKRIFKHWRLHCLVHFCRRDINKNYKRLIKSLRQVYISCSRLQYWSGWPPSNGDYSTENFYCLGH